jgi:hypothetical protein
MTEDIRALMGEGPHEFTVDPEPELAATDGFEFVQPKRLAQVAGATAHRGVLQGDEYIDQDEIQAIVEESLGFTYAEVSAAYKTGRPTPEQRQQRERIDSRLLALSRAGGNMTMLGEALGLGYSTIKRALVSAKEREVQPIVKSPAVTTRLVCFKCGEEGARPRQRRHEKCPPHLLPAEEHRTSTVNLCDADYSKGFETRPGNPAYSEFMDRCVITA